MKQNELIIGRFRQKLVKRGAKGLIGLKRQFKIMDEDGSGELDFAEFRKALDDYRVGCTGPEADQIFQIMDLNRSGTINFNEFFNVILGEMPAYRLNIVNQAFDSLDKNGSGTLDLDEVKASFDPSRHPDVQTGNRTVEDCRAEFIDMFSTHHALENDFNQAVRDVSREEFLQYHRYVSAFVEADRMFKVFMSGVWNMDLVETTAPIIGGAPVRPAGVTPSIYGMNSREQWKYDMHRSFFGQLDATPMKQNIADVHAPKRNVVQKVEVRPDMPSAGVRSWAAVEKGPAIRYLQDMQQSSSQVA